MVETDVRNLVDLGLLKAKRIGKSEVIYLDRARDKDIQDIIASHIRSLTKSKDV